jgi:hypothetical protein
MGNHDAGQAMGRMAEMALKMRTNQTALQILDEICEPYRGCDAEFEAEDPKRPGHINPEYADYTDPKGPLGTLIIEAFSDSKTNWIALRDEALKSEDGDKVDEFYTKWSDGPEDQFNKRYEFC